MPEHVFTIVARGHAVDAQTNTLTAFCILEELAAEGFPVAVPELTVITLWFRRSGDEGVTFMQRTRLMDPSGEEVFRGDLSFRMDKRRHRNFVKVAMVPFKEQGTYTLEILIRRDGSDSWQSAARYPLDVVRAAAPVEDELFEEANSPPS